MQCQDCAKAEVALNAANVATTTESKPYPSSRDLTNQERIALLTKDRDEARALCTKAAGELAAARLQSNESFVEARDATSEALMADVRVSERIAAHFESKLERRTSMTVGPLLSCSEIAKEIRSRTWRGSADLGALTESQVSAALNEGAAEAAAAQGDNAWASLLAQRDQARRERDDAMHELANERQISADLRDQVENDTCARHAGQAHGKEAEELRSGIEKVLAAFVIDGSARTRLQLLLDGVDARDSLAYLEAQDERAQRLNRAAERLVTIYRLYGGHTVNNRGVRGCVWDALVAIAPNVAADVEQNDWHDTYSKHWDEDGRPRDSSDATVRGPSVPIAKMTALREAFDALQSPDENQRGDARDGLESAFPEIDFWPNCPPVTKHADGTLTVGPPPDGRSVNEHLEELIAAKPKPGGDAVIPGVGFVVTHGETPAAHVSSARAGGPARSTSHPIDHPCPTCGALEETVCTGKLGEEAAYRIDGLWFHAARVLNACSKQSLEEAVADLHERFRVLQERVRIDVSADAALAGTPTFRQLDYVLIDGHPTQIHNVSSEGKWTYRDSRGATIEPFRVPPSEDVERLYTIREVNAIIAKAINHG